MARYGLSAAVTPPFISQGQIIGPTQVVAPQGAGTLTTDNLYLEFDTGYIPDTPTLVQVLNAILADLLTNGDLPVQGALPGAQYEIAEAFVSPALQPFVAASSLTIAAGLLGTFPISTPLQPVVNASSTAVALQLLGGFPAVTPEQFGAVGDGSHDDTAAINLAIATGQDVYFAKATYKVTATLSSPANGQYFRGAGSGATVVTSTSTTLPVFSIANGTTNAGICSMTISRSATPVAGASGILTAQTGTLDAVSFIGLHDLELDSHWNGLKLGPTPFSLVRDVTVQQCLGDAILMSNTTGTSGTGSSPLQWTLDHILCQFNNGHGVYVLAVAQTIANGSIALGDWKNVSTFGCSLGGVAFEGNANCAIDDIRIGSNCFFGADGNNEIYLDTYGANHVISNTDMELPGQTATGVGFATPASGAGRGVLITANNSGVTIIGCFINGCSYDGISTACDLLGANTAPTTVTGCFITNNGLSAVVTAQSGITLFGGHGGLVVTGGLIGQWNIAPGTGDQWYGITSNIDNLAVSGVRFFNNHYLPIYWTVAYTTKSYFDCLAGGSPIGIITGVTPQAGFVGETISASLASTSATGLTTGTPINVLSIGLTAGIWDVRGTVGFYPASTTVISLATGGVSLVSATLGDPGNGAKFVLQTLAAAGISTGGIIAQPTGTIAINLSAPATVYLVAESAFSVSTCGAYGYIEARRVA